MLFGSSKSKKRIPAAGVSLAAGTQAKHLTNMDIIPAIDIIDGKCVRLTQGDYAKKKIYNEDPLEVALSFEGAGIRRLHLVDLDGAKAGRIINWKVLEKIAVKTGLKIDFGGGVKSEKDVQIIFDSGAAMATIGSMAVKQPEVFKEWLTRYGGERIFLGADVKDEQIAVSGWLEQTDIPVLDFIEEKMAQGVVQLFCTDISKDGLLQGPAIDLYRKILAKFPALNLVASGGVAGVEDVEKLREAGCSGVIIGKAIYEGKIRLSELAFLI